MDNALHPRHRKRPPIRRKLHPRRAGLTAAATLLAAALAAHSCGPAENQTTTPGARQTQPERAEPAAFYTTRGVVTTRPDPDKNVTLEVQHEAIDDFKNAQGQIVGMNTMIMPFPTSPGVELPDLNVNDIVEVTFAVWWEPRPHWEATEVKLLPPDTQLEFRPAQPPTPDPG